MKFEYYRNKTIVVEAPVVHSELAESTINSESIISEPEPELEIETTSDTSEEVSTPPFLEPSEDVAELPKEEATPSTINDMSIENPTSQQNTRYSVPTLWLRRNEHHKKSWIRFSHIRNKTWFSILAKQTSIVYVDILRNTTYPIPYLKLNK